MTRYINASELMRRIKDYHKIMCEDTRISGCGIPLNIVLDIIKDMAVNEYEEIESRPQGRWVLKAYKKKDAWGVTNCFSHTCSHCGANRKTKQINYCPECGADMGDSNMEILIGSMDIGDEYDAE